MLILLALMSADILLHKGMSRVMIPSDFTEKVQPFDLQPCNHQLINGSKEWIKAVNTVSIMNNIPVDANGIEIDLYFDPAKNVFEVYHDSSAPSNLNFDTLLTSFSNRGLNASVWMDIKNLTSFNSEKALAETQRLRDKYTLRDKLVVESTNAAELNNFCKSGFYTSYYIPFFNPYMEDEAVIVERLENIGKTLRQYPSSSLSGYYFQYPLLKKFFPSYPILTWSTKSDASVVSYFLNRQLANDSMVKIVLYPLE